MYEYTQVWASQGGAIQNQNYINSETGTPGVSNQT